LLFLWVNLIFIKRCLLVLDMARIGTANRRELTRIITSKLILPFGQDIFCKVIGLGGLLLNKNVKL